MRLIIIPIPEPEFINHFKRHLEISAWLENIKKFLDLLCWAYLWLHEVLEYHSVLRISATTDIISLFRNYKYKLCK